MVLRLQTLVLYKNDTRMLGVEVKRLLWLAAMTPTGLYNHLMTGHRNKVGVDNLLRLCLENELGECFGQ